MGIGRRGNTQEEFEKRLLDKNINVKLIGLYYGMHTQTTFECMNCGHTWETKPKVLVRSVIGCPECANKMRFRSLIADPNEFKKKIKENNPTIELIGEYAGTKSYIEAKCNECGHLWKPRADVLLRGAGCPKCSTKKRAEKSILPHDVFAKRCFDAGVDVTFIEKYTGQNNYILVRCNKCGHEYYAHPNSLSQGHGCALCKSSIGESRIRCFLEYYSISFIPQFRFDECRNVYKLPFDFYLPDYNTCIEYDGRQHFEPVDFFGGDRTFERQQINDNIKTNFCKNNNIGLIRIPYYQSNNIENILFDELDIIEHLINISPLGDPFEDDFYF